MNIMARFALIVLVVASLASLRHSVADAATPATLPAAEERFVVARLSGKVTDSAGKPVTGAVVMFNRANAARLDTRGSALNVTTDSEGKYELRVRFADKQITVREVFAEMKGYARAGTEVEIPLRGDDVATLDFSLVKGEVLAGEVRAAAQPGNAAGKAEMAQHMIIVEGANVQSLPLNARAYLTEPDGHFEFYLPSGEYTLQTYVGADTVELKGVKTGRRDLVLQPPPFAWTETAVAEAFDGMWQDIDRHYSYFTLKPDIDWAALKKTYRPKAAAARDAEQLGAVLRDMLANLRDLHVRVETPQGVQGTYRIPWRYNGNFDVTRAQLEQVTECGKFALVGKTKGEGFGYFLMLQQSEADPAAVQQAIEAIRALRDTPGFVVDLRRANGGSEPLAAEIASLFCEKETIYAQSKYRNGPAHDNFGKADARMLLASANAYIKPVVCLTGPGAVSSGEGFVKMMKCLPHVTAVGLPTRGASGNPAPLNVGRTGVRVWFSRWVDMTPDGQPFETIGVIPDIPVDLPATAYANGDPTLEKALAVLRTKVTTNGAKK